MITREHFDRAIERIESVLEIYYRAYKRAGWQVAIGTSGTIKYIGALVSGGKAEHVITYDKLIGLRDQIISKGSVKGCNFKNVPLDRQQILPGGLAVLIGVFELLQIDELHYEDAGLREGVIYQELWHLEHPDIRERSVQDLLARHKVDAEQVGRIEATAVGVFDQLATGSNLGYYRNMLRWAANLHEVGRSIRIQGVHDHSKYIVTHSPMPGFSIEQQSVMAWLVGNHRKGISLEPLTEFHQHQARLLRLVLMCLRIAVTLHRSRGSIDELPMATVDTSDQKDVICLSFSKSWLDEHALSAYDLAQEAKRWQKRGWLLQVIALA